MLLAHARFCSISTFGAVADPACPHFLSPRSTSTYTHTEAGREVEHRVWDEMMAVWGDVATDEVHRVLEDCEKD